MLYSIRVRLWCVKAQGNKYAHWVTQNVVWDREGDRGGPTLTKDLGDSDVAKMQLLHSDRQSAGLLVYLNMNIMTCPVCIAPKSAVLGASERTPERRGKRK
jgi:hypothetical protein